MKYYIGIVLLFSSVLTFGQIPVSYSKCLESEGWVIDVQKQKKLNLSTKLATEPEFEWVFDWKNREDSSSLDNLHIVDFNCDGILDVIFDGNIGSESDRIVFMKGNPDGRFSKVIGLWGAFIDISTNDGFTPMSFMINNYSCCSGVMNHLERYTPIWTSSDFEYQLQEKYAKYYTLAIPNERLKEPIKFVTTTEKYNLRLDPLINDTIVLEHGEVGNTIAEYPKGSLGIGIAKHKDETGRIWWFVKMINNIDPNWSLYHDGDNNNANSYYLGWISSRYVTRL